MEQQKIIDEINYYKAQAITELLYASGMITFDEYDKLTDLNRRTYYRKRLKNQPLRVNIVY